MIFQNDNTPNNEIRTSSVENLRKSSETNKRESYQSNRVSQSQINPLADGQVKSTAINNELKAFERMKKKQEMELLGMVQNEIRMESIRKENEEKMRKAKEKEERYKQQLNAARKEEEERKREKERQKDEQAKRDEEERKMRDLQRFKEEQRKAKEEEEKEKERLREARLRAEEEKRKQEELKKVIEANMKDNIRKLEIRQKEMEEKDRIRLEIIERKRIHLIMMNNQKAQRKKLKIEGNLKNLEEKIFKQKSEFMEKQEKNEMKRKQFEDLREIAFKRKQKQSLKRAEEIKQILKKNENLVKMKVENYNEKQRVIQIKKDELDIIKEEENRLKLEKQRKRDEKIKLTLQMNLDLENNKKSEILQKIEYKDIKLMNIKEFKEREHMEKSEIMTRKREERKENINQIARMQEEERMRTFQRLNEKSQRLDDFKYQKSLIADKKREIQDEISRKKQDYMQKFEKIFKKKTINDKTIKELAKMFPDNQEVIAMIHNLKSESSTAVAPSNLLSSQNSKNTSRITSTLDKKKKSPNQASSSITSTGMPKIREPIVQTQTLKPVTKTNQVMPEKEALKKVEDYRMKLNQGLLKLLSEERQKEDERERILASCDNMEERKKLDKHFGIERAQASNRIVEYNEEIEKRIEEFERVLKGSRK